MKAGLTHIARGKLCVLELDTVREIRVTRGRIWLTESGRPLDFVLEAGQTHLTLGSARLLIEAEDEAWFELAPAPQSIPCGQKENSEAGIY